MLPSRLARWQIRTSTAAFYVRPPRCTAAVAPGFRICPRHDSTGCRSPGALPGRLPCTRNRPYAADSDNSGVCPSTCSSMCDALPRRLTRRSGASPARPALWRPSCSRSHKLLTSQPVPRPAPARPRPCCTAACFVGLTFSNAAPPDEFVVLHARARRCMTARRSPLARRHPGRLPSRHSGLGPGACFATSGTPFTVPWTLMPWTLRLYTPLLGAVLLRQTPPARPAPRCARPQSAYVKRNHRQCRERANANCHR